MSKRKNTLNDLQEFLKLQASTLVSPQAVEAFPSPSSSWHTVTKDQPDSTKSSQTEFVEPKEQIKAVVERTFDIHHELKSLAEKDRGAFYEAIIKATESLPGGTKDVLLINTALYLKHGDNWKWEIEEYWKAVKS